MRSLFIIALGLMIATPALAQVPTEAVSQVPRSRLPAAKRIQLLEDEVRILTNTLDSVRTEYAKTAESLRDLLARINAPEGKTDDDSAKDLWMILRKMSDRMCRDQPKPCP